MHTIRWCKAFTRMRVLSIRFFSFASLIVCIDLTSLSRPETGLVNFFSGAVVHQACLHQFVVRFAFVFRQSLATLGSKWKPHPVDRGLRQSGPQLKGNSPCADAVFSSWPSSAVACNTRWPVFFDTGGESGWQSGSRGTGGLPGRGLTG